MPTVDELLRMARKEQQAIAGLKDRLSHAQSYTERQTLNRRIRQLEDRLAALYAQYLRALKQGGPGPVTVFGTTKKPRTVAGLSVSMDISTDGTYFSNPAPQITNSKRVWVRLKVDVAQKSPFATTKTDLPEMVRCTWVIPKRWVSQDIYGKYGRVEYVVSSPLVVTREFKAPSSGSTKANFGCFVDPYYPIDLLATAPPATAPVEVTKVSATFEAGSYLIYTRASNVLILRESVTFATDTSFLVDETDETFFYTNSLTYLSVREILSGEHAGKFFISGQAGVTFEEAIE